MSIYAVKVDEYKWDESAAELVKMLLRYEKCNFCGGVVSWARGYMLHSAPYGGSRKAWCSEKCLNSDI